VVSSLKPESEFHADRNIYLMGKKYMVSDVEDNANTASVTQPQ
jgi:hypothetical protein